MCREKKSGKKKPTPVKYNLEKLSLIEIVNLHNVIKMSSKLVKGGLKLFRSFL